MNVLSKVRVVGIMLLTTATIQAAPTSTLRGVITDSEGAAIARANVMVRGDASGSMVGLNNEAGTKRNVDLVTDSKGYFSSELPPGFYDVFVSADGFSPQCRKIRITPGQVSPYRARLQVDPLVIRELGDRIPK